MTDPVPAEDTLTDQSPEALLDELAERPIAEHPEVLARVDESLTEQLGALDDLD